MSHAVGRTRYSVEEFETEVAYDKPLGLDAYGYEEHIDGNIGEKEAESEQHAIDLSLIHISEPTRQYS